MDVADEGAVEFELGEASVDAGEFGFVGGAGESEYGGVFFGFGEVLGSGADVVVFADFFVGDVNVVGAGEFDGGPAFGGGGGECEGGGGGAGRRGFGR